MSTTASERIHKVGPAVTIHTDGTLSQEIELPGGITFTIAVHPMADVQEMPIAKWNVAQLYREIEYWRTQRANVHGHTGPEAAQVRAVAAPEIKRIRAELYRRGLPGRAWLYEAQLREQDAKDEAETMADVRYG